MEFVINLTKDQYTNFANMLICLPITFEKRSNVASNIDDNFFTHWIREINAKRYGDEIAVLPLNNVLEIYRYSNSMLKHLPGESLETFQQELLYSKKPVIL